MAINVSCGFPRVVRSLFATQYWAHSQVSQNSRADSKHGTMFAKSDLVSAEFQQLKNESKNKGVWSLQEKSYAIIVRMGPRMWIKTSVQSLQSFNRMKLHIISCQNPSWIKTVKTIIWKSPAKFWIPISYHCINFDDSRRGPPTKELEDRRENSDVATKSMGW